MKTLEQLAGWLLFSLSILMVYGFLSLFVIGPAHAGWDLYGFDGTMFYKSYDSLAACEQDRPKIEGLSECRPPRPNYEGMEAGWVAMFRDTQGHWSDMGLPSFTSEQACKAAIAKKHGHIECSPYRGAR